MKSTDKERSTIEFTEQFKKRALELIDETQAIQFAEGLRLNSAAEVVFRREADRLERKHGPNDSRTLDMKARLEASSEAKRTLHSLFVEATSPAPAEDVEWQVIGVVLTSRDRPVGGLTIGIHDRQGKRLKEFGEATTDDNGRFRLEVRKLPDKLPAAVFVRAAQGSRVLPSNDVMVTPKSGATERIKLIIADRDGHGEETKPNLDTAPKPTPDGKPGKEDRPGDKDKIDATAAKPSHTAAASARPGKRSAKPARRTPRAADRKTSKGAKTKKRTK